jgi:hypothetical protein
MATATKGPCIHRRSQEAARSPSLRKKNSELGRTILGARHRQEAIGVTTPCTPRKSQPKSYPPLGSEKTSELGRIIGTDLRILRLAIAIWEKGASRVNDCEAIGGSAGWKNIARVWAGEKGDRSSGAVHLSQDAVGSHSNCPTRGEKKQRVRTLGLIQAALGNERASVEGPFKLGKKLVTYRTRSQWRDVARRPNRTAVPRGDTPRPRCRRCPSPGEAPYPMASTDSCA